MWAPGRGQLWRGLWLYGKSYISHGSYVFHATPVEHRCTPVMLCTTRNSSGDFNKSRSFRRKPSSYDWPCTKICGGSTCTICDKGNLVTNVTPVDISGGSWRFRLYSNRVISERFQIFHKCLHKGTVVLLYILKF